jgi:hypothetical protein
VDKQDELLNRLARKMLIFGATGISASYIPRSGKTALVYSEHTNITGERVYSKLPETILSVVDLEQQPLSSIAVKRDWEFVQLRDEIVRI